jgi:pimeloyl-ACP methyl ester carboxylesterase
MRAVVQSIWLALVLTGSAGAGDDVSAPPLDPHAILATVGKVVSPNGLDEAKAVEIGGIQQWITVRGRDRRNPILLLIHGGPAAPDLPNRYLFEGPWTDFFTVVEWDQRGSGKTYGLNDPAKVAPTLHKERMIEDTEELIAYLRRTYVKKKIFVMGHSWGTILGLSVAERRPEWLYAYIGAGQIINMVEGERIGYKFVLDTARKTGDVQALSELTAIEPYPESNGDIPLDKINVERKWSVRYGGLTYGRKSYDVWEDAETISPDYSPADFHSIHAGSVLSLPRLLPEMAATDFSKLKRLDCPVIIFAGRFDYTTPNAPVIRWYDRLAAPRKRFVWFENSAHMMYEEEPGRALMHLVQDALPLAAAAGDVAPLDRVVEELKRRETVNGRKKVE